MIELKFSGPATVTIDGSEILISEGKAAETTTSPPEEVPQAVCRDIRVTAILRYCEAEGKVFSSWPGWEQLCRDYDVGSPSPTTIENEEEKPVREKPVREPKEPKEPKDNPGVAIDGHKLREARIAAGLTQVQVAKLVGVSGVRISQFERWGRCYGKYMGALSAAVGLPISALERKFSGAEIKSARMKLDMTQGDLGQLLGMGRSKISFFETGRLVPTGEEYYKLAKALKLPY